MFAPNDPAARIAELEWTLRQRETAIDLQDGLYQHVCERHAALLGALAAVGLRIQRNRARGASGYVATLDDQVVGEAATYGEAAQAGVRALVERRQL